MRRALVAICLALPFLFVLFAVPEAVLRLQRHPSSIYYRPSDCLRFDPIELMRSQENCTGWSQSPLGRYSIVTNEDGLRDRPRSHFSSGAIFALGDSHVEGFTHPVEDGLVRRLENRLSARISTPLLNLGMRGFGPSQLLYRIERILPFYTPKGAIWFLNPTDPSDEIYYHEMKNTPPIVYSSAELFGISILTKLSHYSYFIQFVRSYLFVQRRYERLTVGKRFVPAVHCTAINSVNQLFHDRGLNLVFVTIPHSVSGPVGAGSIYHGRKLDAGEFNQLLDCAKSTGRKLIDLRQELLAHPQWFWPSDWHLTKEGTENFVELLAPHLENEFRSRAAR